MQGSLDDYLKTHAAPKPITTFAQTADANDYDFSAVDQLDGERIGYRTQANNQSHYDEDSFEATSKPISFQKSYNPAKAKVEKAHPRKELQAYAPVQTALPQQTGVRRRDRDQSQTKKKPISKPPVTSASMTTQHHSSTFQKPTTSSLNRSKSPAPPLMGKTSNQNASTTATVQLQNQAKLSDLCPEDKSKIGDLVKKLASEAKQRQESETRFNTEKTNFEERLKQLQMQAESYQKERDRMEEKLRQGMGLLKDLKTSQSQIEQERMGQANELLQVRDELVETRKREESERRERDLERKRFQDETDRLSRERSLKESELMAQLREKDSLLDSQKQLLSSRQSSFQIQNHHLGLPSEQSKQQQENAAATNGHGGQGIDTVKEISELKHEIQRLTESLSGFATMTQQSMSQHQHNMQSQRSLESKNAFTEVHRVFDSRESTTNFEKMDLDDLYSVQEELKKKMQTTNQLIESRSRSNSVRSTSTGKHHASDSGFVSAQRLNDKLNLQNHAAAAMSVEKASSLSRSPRRDTRTTVKQHKTEETQGSDRLSRVQSKAQKELNNLFDDDDSEPESPRNLNNLDVVPQKLSTATDTEHELLNEKMSIFQQIKSRFDSNELRNGPTPQHRVMDDSFQARPEQTPVSSHPQGSRKDHQSVTNVSQDTPSFYKQMVMQQKQALSMKQPQLSQPEYQQRGQPEGDSDDDLAYLLNKRDEESPQVPSYRGGPPGQKAQTLTYERSGADLNQSVHSQALDFNESLFTVIDEIENETASHQTQQQQQSRPQPHRYNNQHLLANQRAAIQQQPQQPDHRLNNMAQQNQMLNGLPPPMQLLYQHQIAGYPNSNQENIQLLYQHPYAQQQSQPPQQQRQQQYLLPQVGHPQPSQQLHQQQVRQQSQYGGAPLVPGSALGGQGLNPGGNMRPQPNPVHPHLNPQQNNSGMNDDLDSVMASRFQDQQSNNTLSPPQQHRSHQVSYEQNPFYQRAKQELAMQQQQFQQQQISQQHPQSHQF